MREHKTIGNATLAFRAHKVTPPKGIGSVQAYADTELVLLRLWIDEDIAPHFRILGLLVNNVHLLQGVPGIPAGHFSMAHRDKYHLTTEWKEAITPANRVAFAVENTSDEPHEFRGLFECLSR